MSILHLNHVSFIFFEHVESCKVNIEYVIVIEQCALLFYYQIIFDEHLVQFQKNIHSSIVLICKDCAVIIRILNSSNICLPQREGMMSFKTNI